MPSHGHRTRWEVVCSLELAGPAPSCLVSHWGCDRAVPAESDGTPWCHQTRCGVCRVFVQGSGTAEAGAGPQATARVSGGAGRASKPRERERESMSRQCQEPGWEAGPKPQAERQDRSLRQPRGHPRTEVDQPTTQPPSAHLSWFLGRGRPS